MQHTTTRDYPPIGSILERFYAQGKVLLQFLLQTIVDVARSNKLTLFAEERRIVDGKEHRHGGLVNGDRRQGLRILDVADGVANLEFLQTNHSTDVATIDAVGAHMAHTVEDVQLLDLRLLQRTVTMGDGHLLAVLQGSAMYTAHGNAASVRAIVERGDEHLRRTLQLLGSRYHLDNLI